MSGRRRRRAAAAPLRRPVPGERAGAVDRLPPLLLLGAAVLVSAGAHLAAGAAMPRWRPSLDQPAPRPQRVEVAVVEKPAAVAQAAPAPLPAAPTPRPRRHSAPERPAAPAPAETPPVAEPAPPGPQPPVLLPGLALSAITAGTMGVNAGHGAGPAAGAPPPSDSGEGGGVEDVVPGYALTEEPVFLENVSPAQVRRYYPEEARRARIEGAVLVKLTVDGSGQVVRVRVIDDPGHGFGPAAARLARLYRFRPARVDGRPVATEIQFTIHFELD